MINDRISLGDRAPDPWDQEWIGATDDLYSWTVLHADEDTCSRFSKSFSRFELMESNVLLWYLARLEPMHSMFLIACPECVARTFIGSFGVVP